MPTFQFYKNGAKTFEMQGADPNQLTAKVAAPQAAPRRAAAVGVDLRVAFAVDAMAACHRPIQSRRRRTPKTADATAQLPSRTRRRPPRFGIEGSFIIFASRFAVRSSKASRGFNTVV